MLSKRCGTRVTLSLVWTPIVPTTVDLCSIDLCTFDVESLVMKGFKSSITEVEEMLDYMSEWCDNGSIEHQKWVGMVAMEDLFAFSKAFNHDGGGVTTVEYEAVAGSHRDSTL